MGFHPTRTMFPTESSANRIHTDQNHRKIHAQCLSMWHPDSCKGFVTG